MVNDRNEREILNQCWTKLRSNKMNKDPPTRFRTQGHCELQGADMTVGGKGRMVGRPCYTSTSFSATPKQHVYSLEKVKQQVSGLGGQAQLKTGVLLK